MARPSKGKKALKSQQKTAKPEKPVQMVDGEGGQYRSPSHKLPGRFRRKRRKKISQRRRLAVRKCSETAVPAQPVSFVDRAITFIKSNLTLCTLAVVLLMGFMFYIRTVPAHDLVFTNWPWINGGTYVNVAADDGVYHMRLLDNTLQHFPFRILYDPFTHFPYGNIIHFGPLFELIPAAVILHVRPGTPDTDAQRYVSRLFPGSTGHAGRHPDLLHRQKTVRQDCGDHRRSGSGVHARGFPLAILCWALPTITWRKCYSWPPPSLSWSMPWTMPGTRSSASSR